MATTVEIRFSYLTQELLMQGLLTQAPGDGRPLIQMDLSDQRPSGPPLITTYFDQAATPAQIDQVNVIITEWDWNARRPRLIFDVFNEVKALTGAQLTKVWNDLNVGTTPKWAEDRGTNAADLHVLWMLATQLGVVSTQADKRQCQVMLISIYTVDNPKYLVSPSFDPTINIPGDETVP